VARVSGLSPDTVRALIAAATHGRALGMMMTWRDPKRFTSPSTERHE
jgi:hypothetical protein